MKLKTRLSLIFGTVVLVIVATIGIVTYNKNVEMGTADAKKTMQISAELAAKEIEGKLSDFKNMNILIPPFSFNYLKDIFDIQIENEEEE